MTLNVKRWIVAALSFLLLASLLLVAYKETRRELVGEKRVVILTAENAACVNCHLNDAPALEKEWENSMHAKVGIGCIECHSANKGDVDAWKHEGVYISVLVTPLDCAECHDKQYNEFANSPHAKAGELFAGLDESERAHGVLGNIGGSVGTCQQCHGSVIKFERDEEGKVVRTGSQKKPVILSETWPNSGMGRVNPDGSKGTCTACHGRHSQEARLPRSPEACGKCHMGPRHPQFEIYNESRHGIVFYSNRDKMNLERLGGEWILGRDYSAAPTCVTCHMGSYMNSLGFVEEGSHNVGARISWNLRPVIGVMKNLVIYEDGYQEDYPEERELPESGDEILTTEYVLKDDRLVGKEVRRTVEEVLYADDRREKMIEVCLNCHNDTVVDNFYEQYDSMVELYNETFAIPAKSFMDQLTLDGIISPDTPWARNVQWIFWDLWHQEGRAAMHGASMMGPSFTRNGMYDLSKKFATEFLPAVIDAAASKGPDMKSKYQRLVDEELSEPRHAWLGGFSVDGSDSYPDK